MGGETSPEQSTASTDHRAPSGLEGDPDHPIEEPKTNVKGEIESSTPQESEARPPAVSAEKPHDTEQTNRIPDGAAGEVLGKHATGRAPVSVERGSSGESARTDKQRNIVKRRKKRLTSYVYLEPDHRQEKLSNTARSKHNRKIERAGIKRVIEYEKQAGRTPVEMDHYNKGFDITSIDSKGHKRFIEVKAMSSVWDASNPARLTSAEYERAQKKGGSFWLYIVERVESPRCKLHMIKDPANQVVRYCLDHGWECIAITADLGNADSIAE